MLRFTIFGIPVVVEPWFWVVSAIFGNAIAAMGSNDPQVYMWVGVWMAICFISILVHELGHAMTGIRLGGGSTWIKLWSMGGLAYNQGGRFTRKTRALMIVAGPGAGLCLFAVVAGVTILMWPKGVGFEILWHWMIFGLNPNDMSYPTQVVFWDHIPKMRVLKTLVMINFWWSLVNLLPVYPLDGGQLLDCFVKSRKKMHQIGVITGATVAAAGYFIFGSFYVAVLFGFLAYQNYLGYKAARY